MAARRVFAGPLIGALLASPSPAWAETGSSVGDPIFAYLLVGGVAIAVIVALGMVRLALSHTTWSLADALSEEADISPLENGRPLPGPDGKPQIVSELCASSSRLIALLGLIGILMIYLGFGLAVLKDFANNPSTLPGHDQMKDVTTFLFAGITMFAPYIVNKFSSIFEWLTPKK